MIVSVLFVAMPVPNLHSKRAVGASLAGLSRGQIRTFPKVGIIGHEFTSCWQTRDRVLCINRARQAMVKWGYSAGDVAWHNLVNHRGAEGHFLERSYGHTAQGESIVRVRRHGP